MNVARLNMSHGDHASHQKVIDLVKEYNAQSKDNVIAIMLDTKASFYLWFFSFVVLLASNMMLLERILHATSIALNMVLYTGKKCSTNF